MRGARACLFGLLLVLAGASAATSAPPDAALADAARHADWAAVRTLLAEGADVDAPRGGRLDRSALGELPEQPRGRSPADSGPGPTSTP